MMKPLRYSHLPNNHRKQPNVHLRGPQGAPEPPTSSHKVSILYLNYRGHSSAVEEYGGCKVILVIEKASIFGHD